MLAAMDVRCVNYVNVRILVMVAASASLRFLRHCLDSLWEQTQIPGHQATDGETVAHVCIVFCMYIPPEAGWVTAFYGSLGGISRGWKWNVDLK